MHVARERMTTRTRIGRTLIPAFITVLGMALVVAACGSSPTVAAFNSQANSICRTYGPGLKRAEATIALSNGRNQGQLGSAISTVLSQAEQGSAQLEGLTQPDGEGVELTKAFNSANAQIRELKGLAAALKGGNQTKIQSSETAIEESEAPLNQQFDMLGLTDCGSGSVPQAKGPS